MPEGPEIRLAADRLAKVLVDQEIVAASLELPDLKAFEKRLTGSTVSAVDTRGKAMLTRFDNGLTLYSHNQLYGRWFTTERPHLPRTGRQLRVALHTKTHSALLYSASDIEVLTEPQLAKHPFLTRIGPDILDAELTRKKIADRLLSPTFRNRALGSLYLDQSFLAGIGNYLRSEILWSARIDPCLRPAQVDPAKLQRVADETLTISQRSYRTRGVTVPDDVAADRRRRGMSYENLRFQVYGRDGLPCYDCGSEIVRRNLGSRGIFICTKCQSA